MLKICMIPIMTRMIAKLDLKPAIEKLKQLDIFEEGQEKMTPEQMGVIAAEILVEITPQLDKVGKDIPEFVSLYKGCSIQEANELDIAEIIADLKNDDGILNFFEHALRKKVGQEH